MKTRSLAADAWYATGSTHLVGQDYAAALCMPEVGRAAAVVCDGCSSSEDTDIGARLLARAALRSLAVGDTVSPTSVVWRAVSGAGTLGLPDAALDATLLWALAEGESIRVGVCGDGVVAARRRDGGVHLWLVEHPANAPRYPSYALDEERSQQYREQYGEVTIVSERTPDGVWTQQETDGPMHTIELSTDALDLVLLGSDGLSSFVGPDAEREGLSPLDVDRIVDELLAVPQARGRFVARRGRRFTTRTCPARGWRHLDDIAIAAIAIGERT